MVISTDSSIVVLTDGEEVTEMEGFGQSESKYIEEYSKQTLKNFKK